MVLYMILHMCCGCPGFGFKIFIHRWGKFNRFVHSAISPQDAKYRRCHKVVCAHQCSCQFRRPRNHGPIRLCLSRTNHAKAWVGKVLPINVLVWTVLDTSSLMGPPIVFLRSVARTLMGAYHFMTSLVLGILWWEYLWNQLVSRSSPFLQNFNSAKRTQLQYSCYPYSIHSKNVFHFQIFIALQHH